MERRVIPLYLCLSRVWILQKQTLVTVVTQLSEVTVVIVAQSRPCKTRKFSVRQIQGEGSHTTLIGNYIQQLLREYIAYIRESRIVISRVGLMSGLWSVCISGERLLHMRVARERSWCEVNVIGNLRMIGGEVRLAWRVVVVVLAKVKVFVGGWSMVVVVCMV